MVSKPSLTSGSQADRITKWFTTESFNSGATGHLRQCGAQYSHRSRDLQRRLLGAQELSRSRSGGTFNTGPSSSTRLNHTNLNNPETTVSSGSFGRITGAAIPRIIQMALKLRF